MIRIKKSASVPDHLKSLSAPTNENEVDSCDYNHPTVKSRLRNDQHNKCCYCETELTKYADIEHFRPKKAYIDRRGIMHKPGYYWLTADWTNLMLSCKTCNSSHKKNHFGLVDERARDITGNDISRELPLLINPLTEDPGLHIKFRRHCAVEIAHEGNAERGRYTIGILQLNRQSLKWSRHKVWNHFRAICDMLDAAEALQIRYPDDPDIIRLIDKCRKEIIKFRSERMQYSGMINRQID